MVVREFVCEHAGANASESWNVVSRKRRGESLDPSGANASESWNVVSRVPLAQLPRLAGLVPTLRRAGTWCHTRHPGVPGTRAKRCQRFGELALGYKPMSSVAVLASTLAMRT